MQALLTFACALVMLAVTSMAPAAEHGLYAEGAQVKQLADGFTFTEGPAADAEGNVYFTDVRESRIHRWSNDGKLTTFREMSGGANGLYFNDEGDLFACEGNNQRVTRTDMASGDITVLADEYQGKSFNAPNDLWIDPQGGVYFTDPYYGPEKKLEMDGFHVYYISPDRSKVTRVINNLVKPNGVIGTPDGKTLYVADAGDGKTYAYTIQQDGALGNRRLVAPQGSDGMTLDERGNLYLTSGAVQVYSPDGEMIAEIDIPEGPANVTFGGPEFKTLFITARTGLYALPMQVKGAGR